MRVCVCISVCVCVCVCEDLLLFPLSLVFLQSFSD